MAVSMDCGLGNWSDGSAEADLYVALNSRATVDMRASRSVADVIQPLMTD